MLFPVEVSNNPYGAAAPPCGAAPAQALCSAFAQAVVVAVLICLCCHGLLICLCCHGHVLCRAPTRRAWCRSRPRSGAANTRAPETMSTCWVLATAHALPASCGRRFQTCARISCAPLSCAVHARPSGSSCWPWTFLSRRVSRARACTSLATQLHTTRAACWGSCGRPFSRWGWLGAACTHTHMPCVGDAQKMSSLHLQCTGSCLPNTL